jgi:D-serine deaminase-like pyridoxal phosphate-dependent protein
MSWRPLGQHVGVQRSPVRTLSDFARVVDAILAEPALHLAGVMGYEAQIAGLGDENPFAPFLNPAKKLIKSQSTRDVAQRRGEIAELLGAAACSSISSTAAAPARSGRRRWSRGSPR